MTKSSIQKWLGYYTKKRITQQWLQLSLLEQTNSGKILEIGPALGGVTALLVNADFEVTTLDIQPKDFNYPQTPHLQLDLTTLDSSQIHGFDTIICCETLEHISWGQIPNVLKTLFSSGANNLIISVPYQGFQCTWDVYFNSFTLKQYFSLKKFLNWKKFKPEPTPGHQWEIGYKGYTVEIWEDVIKSCGWSIKNRDFSEKTRSIFHLLSSEN